MGLEKAIYTHNENLIELHLNDYDKFRHWNVWYKYVKKKKSKGNSCSYTTFIVRYENCSDLDVHDLSWIWLADKYQEDDIIWPALCFRLELLRRSSMMMLSPSRGWKRSMWRSSITWQEWSPSSRNWCQM